ncbi:MAG: beta-propeller fold lactonase family protein [Thermomicrobiales bacterium]
MSRVRFHRVLQLAGDRRELVRGLATLPLLGGAGLLLEEADAAGRGQKGKAAQAEKKKRKLFCLNGAQVKAKHKKKKRRLQRQGATRGKCPTIPCTPDSFAVTCAARCGTVKNNCSQNVDCGFATVPPVTANVATFGASGSGPSDLDEPYSITLTADELHAYISDYANNRVSIWSRPSTTSVTWSNLTTISMSSTGPDGVTFSADELTMYVAYGDADSIGIWTRPNTGSLAWTEQTTMGSSGSGASDFNFPGKMVLSPDELVMYIDDYFNDRISVWSRANANTNTWTNLTIIGSSGSGPDELTNPADQLLTADQLTMYIADQGNNRISFWSRPDTSSQAWSNVTTLDADAGSGPYGLALADNELTMWVANYDGHSVSVWSRPSTESLDWAIVESFGSFGSGNDEFNNPATVDLSADGSLLYIADNLNHRISIWSQTCPA